MSPAYGVVCRDHSSTFEHDTQKVDTDWQLLTLRLADPTHFARRLEGHVHRHACHV
jgi:hypothetical protein